MCRPPRGPLLGLMIALIALAGAQPTQAQLEKTTVQVQGLACPFCVAGIEKQVKKVEGVIGITTSLKRGELALSFKPGSVFDLTSINRAIVRGGFTPGRAMVTAIGSVKENDGRFVLEVSGNPTSFWLVEDDTVDAKDNERDAPPKTLTQETATVLRKAVEEKRYVQIKGRVHADQDGPPRLAVETITMVEVNEDTE